MNSRLLSLLADATANVAADPNAAAMAGEEIPAGASFVYMLIQMLPMVLIIVVFYFILIRPQRKKDKAAKAMLAALKKGDRICTIGGIYGTIANIKDDVLTVEVGEAKTQMMFARWAVRNVEEISITNDSEMLV
jgi:preprotein translocase subunit YajC